MASLKSKLRPSRLPGMSPFMAAIVGHFADAALRISIHGYPYVSRRHQGLPGCREDANGHPIIESPSHEREVMARTGLVRE